MKTVFKIIVIVTILIASGCASTQNRSSHQMAYIDMATGFKQAFDEEILGVENKDDSHHARTKVSK